MTWFPHLNRGSLRLLPTQQQEKCSSISPHFFLILFLTWKSQLKLLSQILSWYKFTPLAAEIFIYLLIRNSITETFILNHLRVPCCFSPALPLAMLTTALLDFFHCSVNWKSSLLMKWGLRVEDCEQKKRKEKADLVSQNHSQMLCVGSKPHLHILGAFPMEIIFTCGAASLLPVGTSSPPLSLQWRGFH